MKTTYKLNPLAAALVGVMALSTSLLAQEVPSGDDKAVAPEPTTEL